MRKIFLILATSTLLIFTGCINDDLTLYPSSETTNREFFFSDYTSLDISDAFDVSIQFSDTAESIEIFANENILNYVLVYKQDDQLIIELRDDINLRGNFTLVANIKTTEIQNFSASGASIVTLENTLATDEIYINLSGASIFSGDLNTTILTGDISGASYLDITGGTVECDLDVSGASTIIDFDFTAESFKAYLSGASNCRMTISDRLDIVASGGSTLRYKGSPRIVREELSGGSSVRKN